MMIREAERQSDNWRWLIVTQKERDEKDEVKTSD